MITRFISLVAVAAFVVACGGGDHQTEHGPAVSGTGAVVTAPGGSAASTGTVIEITMHTDGDGNYFKPDYVEAKEGDLLRFVLVTGVHNVNFIADSNPNASTLPPMSAYAQIPGQKLDVPLNFGTGEFFYQCDPHAMLGMVGRVKVTN